MKFALYIFITLFSLQSFAQVNLTEENIRKAVKSCTHQEVFLKNKLFGKQMVYEKVENDRPCDNPFECTFKTEPNSGSYFSYKNEYYFSLDYYYSGSYKKQIIKNDKSSIWRERTLAFVDSKGLFEIHYEKSFSDNTKTTEQDGLNLVTNKALPTIAYLIKNGVVSDAFIRNKDSSQSADTIYFYDAKTNTKTDYKVDSRALVQCLEKSIAP